MIELICGMLGCLLVLAGFAIGVYVADKEVFRSRKPQQEQEKDEEQRKLEKQLENLLNYGGDNR
ncbi:MAG: hypothetical protein IJ339_01220 [Oscillospiraceae bacterium]|nr:hypothetical protein [Oscillospiraceae bacterium]